MCEGRKNGRWAKEQDRRKAGRDVEWRRQEKKKRAEKGRTVDREEKRGEEDFVKEGKKERTGERMAKEDRG